MWRIARMNKRTNFSYILFIIEILSFIFQCKNRKKKMSKHGTKCYWAKIDQKEAAVAILISNLKI